MDVSAARERARMWKGGSHFTPLRSVDAMALDVLALADELDACQTRQRLEAVMMVEGIAALEAIYGNGHRARWCSPDVYEAVTTAVLGLRAALAPTEAS